MKKVRYLWVTNVSNYVPLLMYLYIFLRSNYI